MRPQLRVVHDRPLHRVVHVAVSHDEDDGQRGIARVQHRQQAGVFQEPVVVRAEHVPHHMDLYLTRRIRLTDINTTESVTMSILAIILDSVNR
jgi:hypothetical protein